jgi:hypothetical protein
MEQSGSWEAYTHKTGEEMSCIFFKLEFLL